jgi:SEC-C motif-containing protein
MTTCPCNPEKEFDQCCGPYLAGEKQAPTAEALMRSRFSAYAREDYGYVLRTCHRSTRPSEKDFEGNASVNWTALEILYTEAGGENNAEGMVEFIARYESSGQSFGLHEKSRFLKEDGQWFYLDGDIIKPPPVRSEKIGRNEPCPCGSGKKYKKCCNGKKT